MYDMTVCVYVHVYACVCVCACVRVCDDYLFIQNV